MKVGVIMGGISSEREVSLATGEEITAYLDRQLYEVMPIVINNKRDLMGKVTEANIDAAFIALHGQFGEDGTVQSILEALGIPYTGCGVLSSAICMDKDVSKRLMKEAGLPTPPWVLVHNTQELNYDCIAQIGYPVVVKPNSGGSSVATFIIQDSSGLSGAVQQALRFDREVMIEKYVAGDEITCTVIDGKLYPILAIKPSSAFFDYTSKYSDGGAEEVVVELEEKLAAKVNDMTKRCYELLKCSVYARVDMMIEDGKPYILEVNTLPGMTKNSLIPKSARGAGIDFTTLLTMLLECSLRENR